MSDCTSEKLYTISGVQVRFPYKAYPSQITMMDKIIKSLSKQQNCLLESPTGSGKSLALLCAALAWQKKVQNEITELELKLETCLNTDAVISTPEVGCESKCIDLTRFKFEGHDKTSECGEISTKSSVDGVKKRGIIYIDDSDMDDFKPSKKPKAPIKSEGIISPIANQPTKENTAYGTPDKGANIQGSSTALRKTPKIYFGTRTHKQIGQIIRELKKTCYKDVKMTILSARERTCVHPSVSRSDNKEEDCRELIKEGGLGCSFYRNSRKINHYNPINFSSAFDLEEMVDICKRFRACPYFSSRELLPSCEIIFCPYNYLVDPLIRSSMSIYLKGNIIIMDEAHNIEDSSRDAASCSLSVTHLEEAVNNLKSIRDCNEAIALQCQSVADAVDKLIVWLRRNSLVLPDYNSFESSAKVSMGNEMLALLSNVDLGPAHFETFQKNWNAILAEEESEPGEDANYTPEKLSGIAKHCLHSLVQVLTYMYKEKLAYADDYRCVIKRTKSTFRPRGKSHMLTQREYDPFEITINLWCMNPAVALSDMKDVIHSIIVASGTLSPLGSFQSELGMPFQITLEASHVVSQSQMWVGTISKGPSDNCLNGTFHSSETFAFQDEVGNVILSVCSVIPHGVLCFLPSYTMLDKLTNRWQLTGLWDQLFSKKIVICEPKGRAKNFLQVIDEYYTAVKDTENDTDSVNGALLLAVCRGKVSEGLDFADNNARAVITIGIPFPNVREAQIDLKKKYNDAYSSTKQLMSGNHWYEIQAFRALNQALGRCIRHRSDYGALIIVDERFQKNPRYVNYLSKWIRKEISHFPSFHEALSSLQNFAQKTGLRNVAQE